MNGKHYIGKRASSLELYDEIGPITGVALIVDDKYKCFAGDESGYVLTAECPYATDQMAADALAKVQGKTYLGYRSTDTVLPVDAELGDGVTVGGIYSLLAYRKVSFGPGHMSEISAPGENEVDHEYPYVSSTKRETDRKLAQIRSEITKTAEEIRLEILGEDGPITSLQIAIDGITVTTTNADGSKTISLRDGVVTANAIAAGAITSEKISAYVSIDSPVITGGTINGATINVTGTGTSGDFESALYFRHPQTNYIMGRITAEQIAAGANQAPFRVLLKSELFAGMPVALKLLAGGGMSLEAGQGIYISAGTTTKIVGTLDLSEATIIYP